MTHSACGGIQSWPGFPRVPQEQTDPAERLLRWVPGRTDDPSWRLGVAYYRRKLSDFFESVA